MISALVLLAASTTAVEPLRKLPSSLDQRVDAARFICVGTVDEVLEVPRPNGLVDARFDSTPGMLEIARIRVERVLKGDTSKTVVYHEAWGTWLCDTTSSALGSRCLFLLADGQVASMPEKERTLVEQAVGSTLILRNLFSATGSCPSASGKRKR